MIPDTDPYALDAQEVLRLRNQRIRKEFQDIQKAEHNKLPNERLRIFQICEVITQKKKYTDSAGKALGVWSIYQIVYY